MGDEHQGAAESIQPALQPLDPIGIEMVGGLIQQQHIGLGYQGSGQGDTAAIATGEIPHPLVGIPQPDPGQNLLATPLQGPALAGLKTFMQLTEAGLQDPISRVVRQGLAELLVLLQQSQSLGAPRAHLLDHREIGI